MIVRRHRRRLCTAISTNCRPRSNCTQRSCTQLGIISQDPIGFAAGDANLYRYVGNGPTGAVDPSGLDERKVNGYLFVGNGHHGVPVYVVNDRLGYFQADVLEYFDSDAARIIQPEGTGHSGSFHGRINGYTGAVAGLTDEHLEVWREINGISPGSDIPASQQMDFGRNLVEGEFGVLQQPSDTLIARFNTAVEVGGTDEVRKARTAWNAIKADKRMFAGPRNRRAFLLFPFDASDGMMVSRALGATSDFVKPRLGVSSMSAGAVGTAFAEVHIDSRTGQEGFGTTAADQVSGWILTVQMFGDPVEAARDPLAYLRLLGNPSRELSRRNGVQAESFIQSIKNDSRTTMIRHANLRDKNMAMRRVEEYLMDHHALEHGRAMDRGQVRSQARAYLNIYRQN